MTISPNKWELDVQGYLNVCNISDSTARQQIRDFAKGVNDLGLWNSMVCWPLRSSQNYGSGTTAYSLGGLGAYNGVLTNGPVWAVDGTGITFDGTNDHIEVIDGNSNVFAPQNTTFGAMVVSKTAASSRRDAFGKAGPVEALDNLCWGLRDADDGATAFVSDGSTFGGAFPAGTAVGTFRSTVFSYNQSTVSARKNAGTSVTGSFAFNVQQVANQNVRMGAGTLQRFYSGTIAFALFATGLSADKQVDLYTLYKTTLGQGLTELP
jgi:hypothetical protein